MSKRGRAFRRHQEQRAKARAVRKLRINYPRGTVVASYPDPENSSRRIIERFDGVLDPREVGISAATHNARCSCSMCGNPRRHFGEPTIQERKSDADPEFYISS